MSSNEQNAFDEYDKSIIFYKELQKESDRGCVLLASAYLDECLKELLEANTIEDKEAFINLSSGSGGLATFSSRIDLSYLLGLISHETRRHLNIIRRIRNEFAHTMEIISFETQSVSNRCRNLRTDDFVNVPDEARKIFIRAAWGIAGTLIGVTESSIKPKAPNNKREISFEEYLKTKEAQQYREAIMNRNLALDK